jgi:hypothetical protein
MACQLGSMSRGLNDEALENGISAASSRLYRWLQIFGVNDHDSARFVCDLMGQTTIAFQTMGPARDSEKSGISVGEHLTGH